jgi:hypothetical protein
MLPKASVITVPSVKPFWESDNTPLNAATWAARLPSILDEIGDIIGVKRKECYLAFFPDVDFSSDQAPSEQEMDAELALAVNVLECSGCQGLITYIEAFSHCCFTIDGKAPLVASLGWKQSVQSLLEAHKLSAETTTHDDLVEMGSVFVCKVCKAKPCNRPWSRKVLNWEDMVSH